MCVLLIACIYKHIVEKAIPSALTVLLPGSAALDVFCVSAQTEGAKQTRPPKTAQGEHSKQAEPH